MAGSKMEPGADAANEARGTVAQPKRSYLVWYALVAVLTRTADAEAVWTDQPFVDTPAP